MSNTDLHSYTLISSIATVYTCWCWYWQRSIQLCLSIFNAISTTFYAISAGIDPLSQPPKPCRIQLYCVEFDAILAEIHPPHSTPNFVKFDATLAEIDSFQFTHKSQRIRQYQSNSTWYKSTPKSFFIRWYWSNSTWYRQRLLPSVLLSPVKLDVIDQIWHNIGTNKFPQPTSVYPNILLNSTISIKFDTLSAPIDPLSLPPKSCRIWQFRSNVTLYQHQSIPSVYSKIPIEFDDIDRIRRNICTGWSPQSNPKYCQFRRFWSYSTSYRRRLIPFSLPKILLNLTIRIQFDAILAEINSPQSTPKSCRIWQYRTNLTLNSRKSIKFNSISAEIDPPQSTPNSHRIRWYQSNSTRYRYRSIPSVYICLISTEQHIL